MSGSGKHHRRKRRTRAHIIEEMSVNFLERQVLRRGHQLQRPSQREYGWDATMFHFSANGELESGEVRFQLKATDKPKLSANREHVICRVEFTDLSYWYWEDQRLPFIVILYDVQNHAAWWLSLREFVDTHGINLDDEQATISLRIPAHNRLTLQAIDQFRQMSLDRLRLEG